MKSAFLITLLFGLAVTGYSQQPCGTLATPQVLSWWETRAQELQNLAYKGAQTYTVPVHIHIIGDNNGNGYYQTANAFELVCELNQRFAPLQISFFLEDSVTHINNSNYTNPTAPYVNQMMNLYNRPRACNIYLVPNLTGLCGYTYFPNQGPAQGRGGIVLKNGCSLPGNSDPTHEMGHYFSLLHTFQDWNTANAELVNGSNCATKGDHFCDTRADWQDFRWNCPYTGTRQDANGDYYNPDSSLYMGYSNTPCPSRFSAQQQQAILYSRANDRVYLDSITAPSAPALTLVSLLLPADNDPTVPSNTVFRWNKVAGATQYNLRMIPAAATTFNNAAFNVVLPDTFYAVNGLQPGIAYRWEVLPLNYTQTCLAPDAAGIQRRQFGAVAASGVPDVSEHSGTFLMYPNPAFRNEHITLKLTLPEATQITVQVTGMDGRVLYTQKAMASSGNTTLALPETVFTSGIYMVQVSSAAFNVVRKLQIVP